MSRIFKFANIYFGKNSLVKLFANKAHLETHTDYDGTALAFLLDVSDFTNQNALLSHLAIINGNEIRPILIEWNLRTIHGRLLILLNQLPGPHNSCNIIINAPMNAIICNTDAKVLTATAA